MSWLLGEGLGVPREESSELVEAQARLCTSEMSSKAVDIFKAWGEFSPDIEEF